MQGDEQVAARLEPERARPRRARGSAPRARPACRSSCCRRSASARRRSPRRARFSIASSECRKRYSERWSATTRLISSGIVRSKLRSPDSTWPIGISSFAAQSAAASVELTSPGTSTRSGSSATQDRLERLEHAGGLLGVRAGADAEHVVGLGHAELLEEDLRTSSGRSAGRCGRATWRESGERRRSAAITGAILTKFGRVPTT